MLFQICVLQGKYLMFSSALYVLWDLNTLTATIAIQNLTETG